MRTTEFAPTQVPESAETVPDPVSRPAESTPVTYGPPQWARPSYTKGFAGADFSLQPDGTLHCPAGRPLYPVLWGDWQRRFHRRELVKLLGNQRVDVRLVETSPPAPSSPARHLSRAERAHWRLSWAERLARNARTVPCVDITVFGVPQPFAVFLGLPTL